MAVHAGPKIVNDGLVFAYDMYNTDKSWKGAPATNAIFASPTWAGDGTDQGAFAGGSVEITDPNLMYNGLKTFLYSPKSSLNCYLQGSGSDFPGGNPSTVWTFSCYVKREDGAAISSMNVYMYYPSSDGAAAGTVEDVGNGWYRIYRTRTGASNDIGLAGFTSMAGSVKYYLSGAMLTKTDVPVRGLAGTASRSSTQALLDLSKNNYVATASSLTYAADDTFSFASGSADYINIPHASSPVTNLTYEVVINPTTLPAVETYMSVWQKSINWNGTTGISMQFIYGNFGFSFGDSWGGSVSHPQSNFTTGNYYHIVGTVTGNGGTATLYINGIQVDTGVAGTPTDTSDLTVGKGNGGSFNGSMPVFRMYDRCLDSTEVRQNFNAHRGRFGI